MSETPKNKPKKAEIPADGPANPVIYEGAEEVDFADYADQIEPDEPAEKEDLPQVRGLMAAGSSGVGQRMVMIAETQIGVAESGGDNRGVPYERYVKPFGMPPGAWCAYFVSWNYWQTVLRKPAWKSPGWVDSIRQWGQQTGNMTNRPARGDMFGIGGDHIGLVAARLLNGQILTVEGNWADRVSSIKRPISGLWFATPTL
jgi:hypothetical protein